MDIKILAWIYIGVVIISFCTTVLMIGKERTPITPVLALSCILIDLPLLWLLFQLTK